MQTIKTAEAGMRTLPKPLLCMGACTVCVATGIPDLPGCPCIDPRATAQHVRAFEREVTLRALRRAVDWTL